jgi:ATP-binding cassette subfamily B protein
MESEAVESLALTGGLTALVACIELLFATSILAVGMSGWIHCVLLIAWIGLTTSFASTYWRERARWTEARLAMTNDLVERMVGHRTRLAQQAPERWQMGEDEAADHYHELSRQTDRRAVRLLALVPRGWLVLGLVGLVPGFLSAEVAVTAMALSLGGILLAYRALLKLATGLTHLMGAAISWRQVELLFHAAARPQPTAVPDYAVIRPDNRSKSDCDGPLLEARDIAFRYPGRAAAVLQECSLRIGRTDRILLEGASGGGKSTLASMLASLRVPESGLLLLHGLDRHTLGADGWRRRVASAPQFHENHVLTGPFAFNLLMGRRWPPQPKDLEEAEVICKELGLEPLLCRMPAGLLQIVGETGWQLSHGEKSRLYIARALLQDADLVILDESFASLDPPNLRRALECVLEQSRALLVIAHP